MAAEVIQGTAVDGTASPMSCNISVGWLTRKDVPKDTTDIRVLLTMLEDAVELAKAAGGGCQRRFAGKRGGKVNLR